MFSTKNALIVVFVLFFSFFFYSCITDDEEELEGLKCFDDEDCPQGWRCNYDTLFCEDLNQSVDNENSDGESADNENNDEGSDNKVDKDADVPDTDGDKPFCGNDFVESPEVCDGNTKSCVEIDPVLYESGDAQCKTDCSGWNTVTCLVKEPPPSYPVVVSSVPEKNEQDVDIDAVIQIVFNMPMKVEDLRVNSNIILSEKDSSTDINMDQSKATYNPSNYTLTIPLLSNLKEATTYQIRMLNSVTAENGATLNNGTITNPKPEIILFETIAPPVISSSVPADGALNIETSLNEFKIYFSETVNPDQLVAVLNPGNIALVKNEETEGVVYTFPIPNGSLVQGATYEVLLVGAKDLKGLQMPDTTVSFTTKYTVPPQITLTVPESDEMDVPLMTEALIHFNQKMDAATINASRISLKRIVAGNPVDVSPAPAVSLSSSADRSKISADYKAGEKYRITVLTGASGVKNASGIAMEGDNVVWEFTLKESEYIIQTDFSANDGTWLIQEKNTNPGWTINIANERAQIQMTGSGRYNYNVDSYLYTAAPIDLTTVEGAFLDFRLMIFTYNSNVSNTNNDGIVLIIWDIDNENMITAPPVPISEIGGNNLDNLKFFQGVHQGFCGPVQGATDRTYHTYRVDLKKYLGKNIGIAFRFLSDGSWDRQDGSWIDWVEVLK